MAIYVNRNDIEAEIDSEHLARFLDDSGDGTEDAGLFNLLAESVDNEILGIIATLSTDVVTALQSYFRFCGKVLFCSLAYRRKGIANENNPFETIAKDVRTRLSEIQKGEVNFRQLKTLSYLAPARSFNKFSASSDRIENYATATPSITAPSGELVLTAPDGKQYKMVGTYSGGFLTHSWEEIV